MTANQDAAGGVLAQMGIPPEDQAEALAATELVVDIFRTPHTPGLAEQWQCAAEMVGAFAVVTGTTGAGLRQITTIARAAYKLQRFD